MHCAALRPLRCLGRVMGGAQAGRFFRCVLPIIFSRRWTPTSNIQELCLNHLVSNPLCFWHLHPRPFMSSGDSTRLSATSPGTILNMSSTRGLKLLVMSTSDHTHSQTAFYSTQQKTTLLIKTCHTNTERWGREKFVFNMRHTTISVRKWLKHEGREVPTIVTWLLLVADYASS